ncbi:MAG: YncE family protein, partial [Patescibacteria group bacterium]|nr:YncE family protein [Patescibacteria group bacterium]
MPNSGDSDVSVIDVATNAVINTLTNVGSAPTSVVITPDGSRLYLADGGTSSVGVVDLNSNTFIASIPVNLGLAAVTMSPDGSKVYASNNNCCSVGAGNGTVSVINTATNTVSSVITVGPVPNYLDITSDGAFVYVPNAGSVVDPSSNTVSVVNTSTNTVVATVTVGVQPYSVAIEKTPMPPPNQPPSINPISNAILSEGSSYLVAGSFTDSDSTSWTGTVDYGDGSGSQPLVLNADKSFTLSHAYTNEGTYTVTVSVTDNQGATGTGTATITVTDIPASISTPTVPSNPTVGSSVSTTATFTDPDSSDTHAATITWGDGSSSAGTVTEPSGSTPGSVSGSHTYATAGSYIITISVI